MWCSLGCQSGGDGPLDGLLDAFTPQSPRQAAADAFNVFDADRRRRAVAAINASPFGGERPYVRMYRLLATDPDATVRASAAAALGDHGSPEDTDLLIPMLGDEVGFVRWQAARALQKVHDPAAIDALIEVVDNDDDADARAAAVYALGQYDSPSAFDAAVSGLLDPDFAVASNAEVTLQTLTGQDLGAEPADWLAWADGRRDRLFVDRRAYGYRPYQPTPGLLARAVFWRSEPELELREPQGMASP
ncbi:MAG: HEAT repeat domain-containing protein [Planctomycetota bacterium]